MGLPLLAYTGQQIFRSKTEVVRIAFVFLLLLGSLQFKTQAQDLVRFWSTPERSRAIAGYLKKEYAADPSIRIYCDHPEVRVASGIPRDQFYDSWTNGGAPRDQKGFLEFLRARNIKFLMIPQEAESSTPRQLFPNLMKEPVTAFEDLLPAVNDSPTDSLYRVRLEKLPPG